MEGSVVVVRARWAVRRFRRFYDCICPLLAFAKTAPLITSAIAVAVPAFKFDERVNEIRQKRDY
jgi:hypothetical protein